MVNPENYVGDQEKGARAIKNRVRDRIECAAPIHRQLNMLHDALAVLIGQLDRQAIPPADLRMLDDYIVMIDAIKKHRATGAAAIGGGLSFKQFVAQSK